MTFFTTRLVIATLLVSHFSLLGAAEGPAWGRNNETNREWMKLPTGNFFDKNSVKRNGEEVRWVERSEHNGQVFLNELAMNCRSKEWAKLSIGSGSELGWSKPQLIPSGSNMDVIYQKFCSR